MSHFLPPALLALFAPRPPLIAKPPIEKNHNKKYTGIAEYISKFTPQEYLEPLPKYPVSKLIKEEKKKISSKSNQENIEKMKSEWNPNENEYAITDPQKTLFVGRLHYSITESELKREFDYFGKVKKVVLVGDIKTGKQKGYAFIEFATVDEMKDAFNKADGRKIRNRRIVVDIERGRTISSWLPRRLGGGKGKTRFGAKKDCQTYSGRERTVSEREYRDDTRPRDFRDVRDRDNRHRDRHFDHGYPKYHDNRDRDRDRYRDRSPRGYRRNRSPPKSHRYNRY